MPNTNIYSPSGTVKADPLQSGRIINVREQSGDTDSEVVFSVPAQEVISRRVVQQNLKTFERENVNDGLSKAVEDAQFCGAGGAAYSYSNALTEKQNRASKSPNETYPGAQADDRCDFGKDLPPTYHPNNIPRSNS